MHTGLSISRRNSPNAIAELGELSRLAEFVFDKRQGQRASAKKHRRNRHYEKQFIRNTLAHLPQVESADSREQGPGSHHDRLAGQADGL